MKARDIIGLLILFFGLILTVAISNTPVARWLNSQAFTIEFKRTRPKPTSEAPEPPKPKAKEYYYKFFQGNSAVTCPKSRLVTNRWNVEFNNCSDGKTHYFVNNYTIEER